jgi:hypothetical protein
MSEEIEESIFDSGAGSSRRRRELRRAMPVVPAPRTETSVVHDTVFDDNMRAVFSREPAEVIRRLHHGGFPDNWTKVCIGATGVIVSVPEYLYGDLHSGIVKTLWELMEAREKPIYVRDPERFKKQVDRYARKLIERIRNEGEK